MSKIHRRCAVLAIFAAMLLLPVEPGLAVSATKVLGTPRNEIDGSADTGYFAYSQGRVGHPNRVDAYLKPPGTPRIKVNAAGTQGFHPLLDIGNPILGDVLVFVQKGAAGRDIKIWDVDAGGRSNPPAGVNTSAGESKPSIDGNRLMFGRGPANKPYMTKVILFDLTSDIPTVIDTAPTNGIVYPGTVNGDWATWTECSPSDCRAWRYQISIKKKTEVPSTARLIYTSAIGIDGTVWFIQSGIGCGANVKMRRHVIHSSPTTTIDFPAGVDANIADLDDSGTGRQVYFDRVKCSNTNNWDIYRVRADV